jgi:sarcosine oxidase delta subunit
LLCPHAFERERAEYLQVGPNNNNNNNNNNTYECGAFLLYKNRNNVEVYRLIYRHLGNISQYLACASRECAMAYACYIMQDKDEQF